MTALPISELAIETASNHSLGPLKRLFSRTQLADLPASARDLRYDTDHRPGVRKTLLTFTADRADVMLFVALSPALRQADPQRLYSHIRLAGRFFDGPSGGNDNQMHNEEITAELDFPWWRPDVDGQGRRFAYNTPAFDFVEVIIDEERGRVYIRAID